MPEHTTNFEGDIPVVKFMGSITSLIPAPMPGIGDILLSGYKKVIFDASEVTYINSEGLSSIINTHRHCHKNNVHMVIAGAKPDVMKIIRVARANLFIPIYDNVQTAIKEIRYVSGTTIKGRDREDVVVIQKNIPLSSDLVAILDEAHQMQNYNIITKTSMTEALEYIKENECQLVIVEVNFDNSEVEAFIASISMTSKLSVIPILVASPKPKFELAYNFIINGADDFLPHPFDEYETPTRIRNLLELYYIAKIGAGGQQLSGLKLSRQVRGASSGSGRVGGN